MDPLGNLLLAASARPEVRTALLRVPVTRRVVQRFVAGDTVADAVRVVARLRDRGLPVSLDHLGEQHTDAESATAAVEATLGSLDALAAAGLSAGSEVSVKLSAIGQAVAGSGSEAVALATRNARRIADAAAAVGALVTLDAEDAGTIDDLLQVHAELRRHHPDVGVVQQAMLRRTESELPGLAASGARIRLVKGAYAEPPEVAHQDRAAVDRAYARCLAVLMAGPAHPMVATHDPRCIVLAGELAGRTGRSAQDWEHQLLYGIRPQEQQRLVDAGRRVRVYVPWGTEWYGYFTRRLAERPANLQFFLRSLVTHS
ncbi:proline dehydrogenase family protein [Nakamurella leprariae]|uniref:proline dehydrogenase n=1 Tax=Nakamurella leprariae TaxID=2803911 RepID=A0A939BY11_9ACTN|nr:proline dehydrogenase family protein [Nakamurella leprariae]MBM9469103.1 proline dehydrogenase family protein [Nakamurella leprariae]